jgi:CubicO group peptidase (beta-lactamase class C family)
VQVERLPGSGYAYSGGSYQVVQQLVEDRSGEPFASAVRRQVFRPLGMSGSRYRLPDGRPAPEAVARGHAADGAELEGGWREVPELAAGGLWSTPGDLARLLIAISNAFTNHRSDWLAPTLARQMLTASSLGPYGPGVAVAGEGRDLVFMKRGQNVGYQA